MIDDEQGSAPWPLTFALGLVGGIVGGIGGVFIVSCALWRKYVS